MTDIFNLERIAGKRILITGGTTGIGRAVAIKLAACSANIVIVGRDQQAIEDTLEAIQHDDNETKVLGVVADMSVKEDIEKVFSTVKEEFGGLDILINNAGLGFGAITEGDYKDWEYVIRTNVMGYLACSHYALKEMLPQEKGHIIYIGSMSADEREAGGSVYVATKSAIQGFAESLRKEVNTKGINITLIEPGAVDTDMQELSEEDKKRRIEAMEMLISDDIAQSMIYVLSQSERTSIVELKIKPLKQIL
ncbi:SDR family oxidoreductase [Pedobacter xixiisoli]|uniref:NADP-dependent 3-hydroxy acid dehydrogenase YdfG n=1 Tax=Pedobacter xixiisoli TaxID=1476464 RepID=A0A285ZUR0_9SPHI|nr:SDR family oxidoreductase [Pedobacter xixiisoli]SOD13384.1 NADP-dependent 3-hydroxy acid dehydrogenase YdfG [Pedobacter xixiisoli]